MLLFFGVPSAIAFILILALMRSGARDDEALAQDNISLAQAARRAKLERQNGWYR